MRKFVVAAGFAVVLATLVPSPFQATAFGQIQQNCTTVGCGGGGPGGFVPPTNITAPPPPACSKDGVLLSVARLLGLCY